MPRSASRSRPTRCVASADATHDALGGAGPVAARAARATTSRVPRCSCAPSSRAPRPSCSAGDGSTRGVRRGIRAPRCRTSRATRRSCRRSWRACSRPPSATRSSRPRSRRSTRCSSAGRRSRSRLAERAAALGARVVRTYGSSETAGGCVYDGAPDRRHARAHRRRASSSSSAPMLADGLPRRPRAHGGRLHDRRPTARRWYRTGDLGELTRRRTTAGARPRRQRDHLGRREGRARRGRARRARGRRLRARRSSSRCADRRVGRARSGRGRAVTRATRHPPCRRSRTATDAAASPPPPGPCASWSSTGCRCSPRASPTGARSCLVAASRAVRPRRTRGRRAALSPLATRGRELAWCRGTPETPAHQSRRRQEPCDVRQVRQPRASGSGRSRPRRS